MKSFRILAVGLMALSGVTCASLSAAGSTYYLNDNLATTVGIADAAGEIAALEADAFGAPMAAGHAPSRYTGKPYDEDMGAYVFPFRNYRPEEARWMSADPSGFPDGVNGRSYEASLFSELDPNGLKIESFIQSFDFIWSGTYLVETQKSASVSISVELSATPGITITPTLSETAVYKFSTMSLTESTIGDKPSGGGWSLQTTVDVINSSAETLKVNGAKYSNGNGSDATYHYSWDIQSHLKYNKVYQREVE